MARGTSKSEWTVAFDPQGNHLSYDPGVVWSGKPGVTVPTIQEPATLEFDAQLRFSHFERGRSSVIAVFERTSSGNHTTFSMFLSEFESLVPDLRDGFVTGRWGFTKNGSNTGIVRV